MEPSDSPERDITLDASDLQIIRDHIASMPALDFFQIPDIRHKIAQARAERLLNSDLKVHPSLNPSVVKNAVEHNLKQLKEGAALARPDILVRVLHSIDGVRENVGRLRVLSVGPRSESELFALMSIGFPMGHVHGLDLISYSPLVDCGDMHSMPYPDSSFDIIFLGWVLGYSKDLQKVASEVRRVAASGAYVAIACEHNPQSVDALQAQGFILEDDCPRFHHTDDFTQLFQNEIEHIHFRHEVSEKAKDRVGHIMTVFQLK